MERVTVGQELERYLVSDQSPLDRFVHATLTKRSAERVLDQVRADAMGEYLARRELDPAAVVIDTHPVLLVKGRPQFDLHGTIKAIAAKFQLTETDAGPSLSEQVLGLFASSAGVPLKHHRTADYLKVA
jgi:hypothetical protein